MQQKVLTDPKRTERTSRRKCKSVVCSLGPESHEKAGYKLLQNGVQVLKVCKRTRHSKN